MRDHQNQTIFTKDQTVPSKLLIELASLSSENFKIEMKSKYNTISFPISINDIKNNKYLNDSTNVKQENQHENNSLNSSSKLSPIQNDYIVLKCSIVNKDLVLVPPITIFAPYNYPDINPIVNCIQLDEFDDDMLPEYSLNFLTIF